MKYISNVKRLSSRKYTFFQLFIIHKKKYIELLKLLQIPLISKQRIKDRCLFAKERQILSLCTITATSTLGERLYSSVAFRDKATLHLSLSLSLSVRGRVTRSRPVLKGARTTPLDTIYRTMRARCSRANLCV